MSLKGFHIIFIIFSVIVTVIFGIWALQNYSTTQGTGQLMTAIGSFILALALAVYGVLVVKKLKFDSSL